MKVYFYAGKGESFVVPENVHDYFIATEFTNGTRSLSDYSRSVIDVVPENKTYLHITTKTVLTTLD